MQDRLPTTSTNKPPPNIDHLTYQVLEYSGSCHHLKVMRRDGGDGITWDELQAVKDEALGPDALCIEVYPPADALVDELNMRHLWELPVGGWYGLPAELGWNLGRDR